MGAWDWPIHLNRCHATVKDIKIIDSSIVVQAAVNEYIDVATVNSFDIPDYVFKEFSLPYTKRHFDIYKMAYLDFMSNQSHVWSSAGLTNGMPNAIKPDITQLESQMWYYYCATQFIDMGCESINFADIGQIIQADTALSYCASLFLRIRNYANGNGKIRFLLITGHHVKGLKRGNNLLFDFASSPIRPFEYGSANFNGGGAKIDFTGCMPWSIYGRTIGGITPSGWGCAHLLGSVFLDNYGNSGNPNTWGVPMKGCNLYHFDEITWFALQDKSYRERWLKYAFYKIRCMDNNLYFALPIK
ncbi:MAG: hypothetical protein JST52_07765 [Bacteroidetes bacterium]|nr:hypothetical protein [Bacteroidota bacterium]MBS1741049.1 hypothetical protein [Bacteroidota bacterium]